MFSRSALSIDDLEPGMELKGTVRNVVDFGAFVDIGVHQDGLVHISKLANRFVKHPSDVVRVGDTVQLRKMGDIKATVTAISADRTLTLRAGIMNVTAKEQDVYLLENEKPEAQKFAAAHAASLRNVAAESEIDLRGMDTMEAVAATERFLDNAVMAKLEKVTIIHGKGTGALRAAVQQSLRKNKAVKSYRLGRYGEGESGVTVVELK